MKRSVEGSRVWDFRGQGLRNSDTHMRKKANLNPSSDSDV